MGKKEKREAIVRSGPLTGRGAAFALISALALGAALLAAVLMSACSGGVSIVIRGDEGATIAIQTEVPAPLAARFRAMSGRQKVDPPAALFDEAAIRDSLGDRPALALRSLSLPSPESLRAEVAVRGLEELAADDDIRDARLLTVSRGPGWTELRVKLERGGTASLASLFPGIDPRLIEALSPPALEEEPLSAEEYRINLRTVLGKTAMPAMEAAFMTVSLSVPGPVLASGGGSLSGSALTVKIPVIDALVLEKPIEFWIRWKS